MPTFLTGQIMRFKPLIFGGMLFWVAGLVMFFSGNDTVDDVLHIVSRWYSATSCRAFC